jgi:glucosamine--fructose-6-phosphate aminotransferase (isomerizing)
MCGIIGYLGSEPFPDFILQGLRLLQNRGYDSVGVGYIDASGASEITTIKYASTNTNNALDTVESILLQTPVSSTSAIGHTRWATHGSKTDANAHPHMDNSKKIALVHNGIIENFKELKVTLLNEGFSFSSQTDTEIIAVLIGKYLEQGLVMQDAIRSAVGQLMGTWALVIIHSDFPHKMWIVRNGSPLLLGMEDTYVMVASEQIAFGNYIKSYIVLENHDLIEITRDDTLAIHYKVVCTVDSLIPHTQTKFIHDYILNQKTDYGIIDITPPAKYKHWMLKEIEEQGDAIFRAMNRGGRIQSESSVKLGGLDSCKSQLMELNHLILLGCGTSFHAGLWALPLFKSLNIMDTITIYDGAEFKEEDIPRSGTTGVILLSQSGETKDLHRCIQIAKHLNLITIGVVNVTDSLIARETECGVYLNAGREVAVASTKSFTNQCVALSIVAIWFAQNKGVSLEKRKRIISDLQRLPYQVRELFTIQNRITPFLPMFENQSTIFLLGKGSEEAIAKEGALKIKEVAYIHAEGYSSSALKHGPFALIQTGMPIILLDIGEEHLVKNRNAFEEVHARNASILRITDHANIHNNDSLYIPKNHTFGGILANIYIQLLSYYLATHMGYNPDFPRNLAKVVTVE